MEYVYGVQQQNRSILIYSERSSRGNIPTAGVQRQRGNGLMCLIRIASRRGQSRPEE